MKAFIAIAIALCAFSEFSIALPFGERKLIRGTVFNYTVKEGKLSYTLKATVVECNEKGNIKIQWQTAGAKQVKGATTFPYAALAAALEIKIKLKPGNEILTEEVSRWLAGFDVFDYLANIGIDADLKIDDQDIALEVNDEVFYKEILYNKVMIEMNYAEATNSESGNDIRIGFIEYADRVIILNSYVNGNYSMNLVSIQSPVSKTPGKTDKAETHDTKYEPAVASTKKVVLVKMDPAKFGTVKTNYPLLATIENFDATKAGSVSKPITETYEYRIALNSPNPPSLIDCFTADLRIIYKQKETFGIVDIEPVSDKMLPSNTAKKLLQVYQDKDYMKIPGYRPWTNWSFVRSLSNDQRDQLAAELQEYIATYGFSE